MKADDILCEQARVIQPSTTCRRKRSTTGDIIWRSGQYLVWTWN